MPWLELSEHFFFGSRVKVAGEKVKKKKHTEKQKPEYVYGEIKGRNKNKIKSLRIISFHLEIKRTICEASKEKNAYNRNS